MSVSTVSEAGADIVHLRMLRSEPQLELAWWAPALGFLAEQNDGALVRTEHACPVPGGLVPGKRKSNGPTPFGQARFGLFEEPLKPIRLEPVGTVRRTHAAKAAFVGSSKVWAIRTMV